MKFYRERERERGGGIDRHVAGEQRGVSESHRHCRQGYEILPVDNVSVHHKVNLDLIVWESSWKKNMGERRNSEEYIASSLSPVLR